MTDPAVATLTLTLLHALVALGVLALVVGAVTVSTVLSPRPRQGAVRSTTRSASARPATAH